MAIVTFRYWAAAKEAAGIAEEAITAQTLAEALAIATGQAQERDTEPGEAPDAAPGQARDAGQRMRLSAVLARSSFLVDGVPVGVRAPERVLLSDKAVVEVLPPFAGG
jgi:molybdopterin synthase sulfur carrier subunit